MSQISLPLIENSNREAEYKPLPLSNPREYWNLVLELYKSSGAIILGNSLEWLDFSIYGYSSGEISNQIFGGSKVAFWVSFALGFAIRPLGAYVLGKLSDERSRKLSFIIAMLSMSASTALMSLVPAVCNAEEVTHSYCVSSIWAAAIPAIFLRCIQGFSAGAASGGVNVIQSELWSTSERKGVIAQSVGVQNVSGSSASMVSAAVVFGLRAALGEARYSVWGWRIAFLIVVPPSLLASYLIHRTPESNEYANTDGHIGEQNALTTDIDDDDANSSNDIQGEGAVNNNVVNSVDRSNNDMSKNDTNSTPRWLLISVMIFSQFAIAAFNNLNVFLVEFAQTNYGVSANTGTLMQVVGKGVQVLMTPFAAVLADIKGWFWTCAFGGTLCTVLALPMMAAGNYGGVTVSWVLVSGCLPVVSTFWILNAPLMATSIFPVSCRSQWTSMVLATAAAIQGFLPLVLEKIPNVYIQGGVLMAIAALGTMGVIWVRGQAKRGRVIIYQRPELY